MFDLMYTFPAYSFITRCTFLFSTENAAEEELWRENTDYKDPGEFFFFFFTPVFSVSSYSISLNTHMYCLPFDLSG